MVKSDLVASPHLFDQVTRRILERIIRVKLSLRRIIIGVDEHGLILVDPMLALPEVLLLPHHFFLEPLLLRLRYFPSRRRQSRQILGLLVPIQALSTDNWLFEYDGCISGPEIALRIVRLLRQACIQQFILRCRVVLEERRIERCHRAQLRQLSRGRLWLPSVLGCPTLLGISASRNRAGLTSEPWKRIPLLIPLLLIQLLSPLSLDLHLQDVLLQVNGILLGSPLLPDDFDHGLFASLHRRHVDLAVPRQDLPLSHRVAPSLQLVFAGDLLLVLPGLFFLESVFQLLLVPQVLLLLTT